MASQYALMIVILLYSVILHEIAHGVVAGWNGDPTAYNAKRITLNPLPHLDTFGSVILPLALILLHTGFIFAWAKPVPFDPFYFRKKKLGIFMVGIAGPLTNVVLACIFAALFRRFGSDEYFSSVLYYGVFLNVLLALFNLVPIPPLDGSRMVGVFLPKQARKIYYSMERFGFVIVIALVYLGLLEPIKVIVKIITTRLAGISE